MFSLHWQCPSVMPVFGIGLFIAKGLVVVTIIVVET